MGISLPFSIFPENMKQCQGGNGFVYSRFEASYLRKYKILSKNEATNYELRRYE